MKLCQLMFDVGIFLDSRSVYGLAQETIMITHTTFCIIYVRWYLPLKALCKIQFDVGMAYNVVCLIIDDHLLQAKEI